MAVHTDKYAPFLFLFRILPMAQKNGSVFFTVPFCTINSSYVAFITSYVMFNFFYELCALALQALAWFSKPGPSVFQNKLFAFKLVLKKKNYLYLFIWLCWVLAAARELLVVACRI